MRSGIVLILLFLTAGPLAFADEIRVAVASNFLDTLRHLVPLFEQQTGHKLVISAASSGILYAQIKQGAPFDIYMAANSSYPQRLEHEGLTVYGSRKTYVVGQLALVVTERSKLQGDVRETLLGDTARIAIANPRTAPYGAAAVEALKAISVFEQVQSRLVIGENIAQAFQFVATGNAGIALVALSQIHSYKQDEELHYQILEPSWHTPLEQQMVLLTRAEHNAAAKRFLEFIVSDPAQDILEQRGYRRYQN